MRAKNNKWKMNRAGLLNFWYYDDEVFDFADGKLLLRGSNGSGKSVTMQSFLPVLLDGRKGPDRLDPFGSRARKMEDYLLGEKEVVDRDERTGYLFLEYKRADTDQYITTGIGLRAKRHAAMNFWGFIILDNRRIGKDFFLYKTEPDGSGGKEKIPLTRRELENRIAGGGRLVRTQKDYMALVNKHIFGFDSLEVYEDLIKLLIQLRSPKLSKDFKPTVVYEILNASLPALSDDELRPLSDSIESMDQTKQQLDQLIREHRSLQRLCSNYDRYNRFVLAEKAEGLVKVQRERNRLEKRKQESADELERLRHQLAASQERQDELKRKQDVLEEEQETLKKHEVFDAEKQRQAVSTEKGTVDGEIRQKEQSLDAKARKERKLRDDISHIEERMAAKEKAIASRLEELAADAEAAAFAQHEVNADDFRRNEQEAFAFGVWKKEAEGHRRLLDEIIEKSREYERVKARYEEEHQQYGEAQKELDLARTDQQKWRTLFDEEKDRLLKALHQWAGGNEFLHVRDEELQLASQRVVDLYEPYRYEEVKEPFGQAHRRFTRGMDQHIAELNQQLNQTKQHIREKEAELRMWREKKDPEPERREETEEARRALTEKGVPHVPFFAAVEFHDGITEAERERIEAAVAEMGLLDALIVPEHRLKDVGHCDRVIEPNPHTLAHTLGDFLYPTPAEDSGVAAADIDGVLRSILVEDEAEPGSTALTESGSYRIGLVRGHAPRAAEGKAVFIGKESRKRYREQQIRRLQAEVDKLRDELDQVKSEKKDAEDRLLQADRQFAELPGDDDTAEAFKHVGEAAQRVKACEREVSRLNERIKTLLAERERLRRELNEKTKETALELSEKAFSDAREAMGSYISELQHLELDFSDIVHHRRAKVQHEQNLEDVTEDVDGLKGELNVLRDRQSRLQLKLEQLERHLRELGAEDVRRRMAEVHEEIRAIKEELPRLIDKTGQIKTNIKNTEEKYADWSLQLEAEKQLVSLWEEVFKDEEHLRLVDEGLHEGAGAVERAKAVLREWGAVLKEKDDRSAIENRLTNSFYQEQAVLIEYRMTQETIQETDLSSGIPEHEAGEAMNLKIDELRSKAKRMRLLLEYNGQRVSPYVVKERVESDIEVQETLLKERDRELFQEIILNNVGAKIRARISRAEKWVDQINALMDQRDDSSGLHFSIRWKPRTADYDDEMDTKDLVNLLRSKASLLKDEDTDRLTRHFRSQIVRAKEVLAEQGYGDTLHQVIKEMLDYRQWFQFTLYFRREGEKTRELTNNAFYRFSGGEKAMAMYIPLFSAAYSRYLDAGDEAPYIISLDEAFAGVDERNIRDMFGLVEQLGFDYIMNSQALWGDYDSVSALAICELVRPKNAPYVTVVRYHWDGKVKHLLSAVTDGHEPAEKEASAALES
ncbi:MAG TPA: TIGR02680 family protein [Bacillales bacterium]|nr:TIGR02680 family protein [Bacillales bacterium]